MRYDDYDDEYDDYYYDRSYYYNPKREQAIMKNEDLVWLGESMKSSMCKVGQKKVKLFLNSLVKKGDSIAKMYRLILEAENDNINAKKYRNTSSRSYKDEYYKKKRATIEELIREVINYNNSNESKIIFGTQKSDVSETSLIIYFDLPGCEQISFHTDISSNLLPNVPKYQLKWDGKVNSTLPKIERAINSRYYDELYAKYKKEIDEIDEAERIREERAAQLRLENELKAQKERERVENLKSKIIDGIVWDDIKNLIRSKKDAKVVKESINNLSKDAQKIFKDSYLETIDISLPDVREDNLDDLNEALAQFNILFSNIKADVLNLVNNSVKSKLIDELTNAVVNYNSGAVCDTGSVRMYLSNANRYLLENIGGKHTVFFDAEMKPSELSKSCYKIITTKEAKKIGRPKMEISCYLNIVSNNKKS